MKEKEWNEEKGRRKRAKRECEEEGKQRQEKRRQGDDEKCSTGRCLRGGEHNFVIESKCQRHAKSVQS